jgi:hypothetical protein
VDSVLVWTHVCGGERTEREEENAHLGVLEIVRVQPVSRDPHRHLGAQWYLHAETLCCGIANRSLSMSIALCERRMAERFLGRADQTAAVALDEESFDC